MGDTDSLILMRVDLDGKVLNRAHYPLGKSYSVSREHQGGSSTSIYQAHMFEGFDLRADGSFLIQMRDRSLDPDGTSGPFPASLNTRCGALPAVPDGQGGSVAWSDCGGLRPALFVQPPNGPINEIPMPDLMGTFSFFRPTRDGGGLAGGTLYREDSVRVWFPFVKLSPGFRTVGIRLPPRAHAGPFYRTPVFDALGKSSAPRRARPGFTSSPSFR